MFARLRSHPNIAVWERHIRSRLSKEFGREAIIDDGSDVGTIPAVPIDWPDRVEKPRIGLVSEAGATPYWTKFRRFLEFNDIPYQIYEVHRSDWLTAASDFEGVVWRIGSAPAELAEAKRKIYVLEKRLGMICFPSFEACMLYEDKVFQYEVLKNMGFPVVETFISHDPDEARLKAQSLEYPLVNKISTGSASLGVSLIRNQRQALKVINKVFSPSGRLTYWPYQRQKDYVYFQTYEPNEGYDLRILVVGSYLFGYYRHVPEGDFRASGMDDVRKASLPEDALDLARKVAAKLDLEMVAVDFLRRTDGSLGIIETSPFIRIDTAEQLHVDGIPGAYRVTEEGDYEFIEGRFWPQELALAEFLNRRWIQRFGGVE